MAFPQLLFSLLLLLSHSKASSLPSLLALNCTQPSQQTFIHNATIKSLLVNLTAEVTKTRFAKSTISLGQDRFNGLMQCRHDLSPTICSLCLQTAKLTVSTLCPDSEAVTAWFDGCYIQYYNSNRSSHTIHVPKLSCSNQTRVMEQVQFALALDTLLLQLRVKISLISHRGFSNGEILYGNNGSRIYGLAECLLMMSPKECQVCVGEGIKKLHECCGSKEGGFVAGNCIVRFESYRFFSFGKSDASGSDSGGGSGVISYAENENVGSSGLAVKIAWAWCVGVTCLFGAVWCAWLLRRKVINTAKVAIVGTDSGEVGNKGML